MLDKTTARKIAEKYADEVKKILKPDAILLFGSYAYIKRHKTYYSIKEELFK